MNPEYNRSREENSGDRENQQNEERWRLEEQRRNRRLEELSQGQPDPYAPGEAQQWHPEPERPGGSGDRLSPPDPRLNQRIQELREAEARLIRRMEELRQEEAHLTRRLESLRLEEEERRFAEVHRTAIVAKVQQAIYYLTGALGVLLLLRVLLRLFAANPENQFAGFIYELSKPFVVPFETLFGTPTFGQAAFEFNTVIGRGVYALLSWLVVRLIRLIWS
jgi:uncharacterized protein YggT (Ycf19 family)